MPEKINWGILGAATIAMEQVIPAMLDAGYTKVLAIASRNREKAKEAAELFHIPKYYGGYDELLADAQIQAVYIPLPNHLHVEWAIKALRAGKHVLVEKPIALNAEEAQKLNDEAKKYPHLKVMEAFMYRFHPQWAKAKRLIAEGKIGNLRTIQSSFSFFDDNPGSIVYSKEYGGGSLMDIGCYPVSISRFLFGSEPKRVVSSLEYHPDLGVDIHASGTMEFEEGRSVFFSSIQLFEHQQVKLFGTLGSIEFEIPFNPPSDRQARIWLSSGAGKEEIVFGPCNQYGLQVEGFSKAILNNEELPVLLTDAVHNMTVIDAIKESGRLGRAVNL